MSSQHKSQCQSQRRGEEGCWGQEWVQVFVTKVEWLTQASQGSTKRIWFMCYMHPKKPKIASCPLSQEGVRRVACLLQADDGPVGLVHVPQQLSMLQLGPRHLPVQGLQRGCCGSLEVATYAAQLGVLQPALSCFSLRSTEHCKLPSHRQNRLLRYKQARFLSLGGMTKQCRLM